MKTFVAENVLNDYTPGLFVICAKNRKTAFEIIDRQIMVPYDEKIEPKGHFTQDEIDEIKRNLRELKEGDFVYVSGGG